ncbi:hypothetical protein [Sphingomonas faeni]|uniref:hypothetical protein n=1 Tax=Sphingomonas faeni TaxID=185950 RepID=UPI0020C7EE35|nr:hypothetical protein [Sphingomonas faeni]MCP8890109.1 hypothetical protein [Sphingomonas faeni]
MVLIASSVGKGLFDGFIGAGLSPLLVARVSGGFGLATGMTSLALAYFAAVAVILAMRRPALNAIDAVAR